MTQKIYKTAQGKTVDLGSLILQNENTRAVGNMNVNARGDVLDSGNRVIDQKNHQIQRQVKRQTKTNVQAQWPTTSTKAARAQRELQQQQSEQELVMELDQPVEETADASEPNQEPTPRGGLAAAIARAKTVTQELEKTPRQRMQEQSVKRI